MKIKVLHFINSLHIGGAETIVTEYAKKIDKEKFEIEILCLKRSNSPYETLLAKEGVKLSFLSDNKYYFNKNKLNIFERAYNKIFRYVSVREYIKNNHPDIIHFHLNLASYVNFAKPSKRTIIFYTYHSSVQRLLSDKWYKGSIKNIRSIITRYRTHIIALHDDMKKDLSKIFDTDNISVLYNGVDKKRFLTNLSKKEAKERLGFAEGDIVIGNIGRFTAVKNHIFLLKVFKQIKNRLPEAQLLLVGSGDLKERITEEIRIMGLEKNVKIIENRLDIPQILRAMDCFVFPSTSEGFGIVTIEAQFAKCPVVSSDVVSKKTAISNIIHYVSLGESESYWANVIENIILNYDAGSVKFYESDTWDINHIVKELERLYKEEYRLIRSIN